MESGVSDMFLMWYKSGLQSGLALESGDQAYALSDINAGPDTQLPGLPIDRLVSTLEKTKTTPIDLSDPEISVLPPIDPFQEVWAAGVTYKRSEEARESESHNSTIYTRVYSAQRPELFFKALGQDVV